MTITRLHQASNAVVDNEGNEYKTFIKGVFWLFIVLDEQNDSLQPDQESIDSSITTDRETSLHVTSWYILIQKKKKKKKKKK
jgi:hypothetical protein